jgi:hypothetical protein
MQVGHGQKFGRKKQQAIAALIELGTVKAAGETIDVSDSTLWRWMREPSFKSAYLTARRQVVEVAIAKVQRMTGEAADTLREIMLSESNPASSRVQAAKTIIELSLRGIEIADILARIDALETGLLSRR